MSLLLFLCQYGAKNVEIALKTRVNPKSKANLLHFNLFICIFAADFENLYPRINNIFGIFCHFLALNRIDILDVRIHFVETIVNLFMNRL